MADRKTSQLTAASSPLNTWVLPIQVPDGSIETNKITVSNLKTLFSLVKGDVGLGNVDNTSDATKNAASVTLTNKTINLTSNTLVATLSQLNSAVSDDDVAGLAASQTLTNKTMSGALNTFSNIPQSAITSLATDLGLKAPLASPTFTGNPLAPTQVVADDSTKIATTEFVWDVIDDTELYFDDAYFGGDGTSGNPFTVIGATLADGDYGSITVSGSGTVMTIDNSAVTNAMLAGSIAISKLSITGTPDGSKFLRDDGAWATPAGGGGSSTVETDLFGTLSGGADTETIDLTSLDAGTKTVEIHFSIVYSTAVEAQFRIERTGIGSVDTGGTDYNFCRIDAAQINQAYGTLLYNSTKVSGVITIEDPLGSGRLLIKATSWGVDANDDASTPVVGNTYLTNAGALKKIQFRSSGTGFGTNITSGTWRAVAIKNS